jgi:hypothetical protein
MKKLKGYRTLAAMTLAAIPPVLDMLLPVLLLPEWEGVMPASWWAPYTLLVSILGIVLRAVTTTPVGRQE